MTEKQKKFDQEIRTVNQNNEDCKRKQFRIEFDRK